VDELSAGIGASLGSRSAQTCSEYQPDRL